jgi:hypothetical protein
LKLLQQKASVAEPSSRCECFWPKDMLSDSITDVHVVVPFSIGHCDVFDYPGDHKEQMLRDWIGLAITDDALMAAGVLLWTCRYILCSNPSHPVFTQLVLHYKRVCLRALVEEINSRSKPPTSTTAAKAMALAIDEVRL